VANIDPKLIAKIKAAKADQNKIISIAISLTRRAESESASSNDDQTKITNNLLSRTQNITKEKPISTEYLPKLNVLLVEARTQFIEKLIDNPEVSSVVLSE
jgi:hypothetical protein